MGPLSQQFAVRPPRAGGLTLKEATTPQRSAPPNSACISLESGTLTVEQQELARTATDSPNIKVSIWDFESWGYEDALADTLQCINIYVTNFKPIITQKSKTPTNTQTGEVILWLKTLSGIVTPFQATETFNLQNKMTFQCRYFTVGQAVTPII